MSYIINTSSGNVLLTVQDGTTNNSTGLTLIGRNYTGYGNLQNENFVKLLENFASASPPSESIAFNALIGSLWYDTANQVLKSYDGTNYNVVSGRVASSTEPVAKLVGDQWWDTVNLQLKSWTGTVWQVVGPAYTAGQGVTGTIPGMIVDSNSVTHIVANTYTSGNLISITSYDATFTPASPVTGFDTIAPGINLLSNTNLNGNAVNSLAVGNILPNQIARKDIPTTFAQGIEVVGNVVMGYANIQYVNNSLGLSNLAYQGNVDIYVNTNLGPTDAIHVDGSTGLVTVVANPVTDLGVVTKKYVDSNLSAITLSFNSTVEQLKNQFNSNIVATILSTNSNLRATQTAIYSNIATIIGSINNLNFALGAELNSLATITNAQETEITSINNRLSSLATRDSPAFIGIPTAPTPVNGDNSDSIATTSYVDLAISINETILNNRLSLLRQNISTYITSNISGFANLVSPAFTGTPTAPMPPSGDNSTAIATTSFVQQATSAKQFNYSVSTNLPGSGSAGGISSTNNYAGNPGDFWFQIG